jgi:hypothetical protein
MRMYQCRVLLSKVFTLLIERPRDNIMIVLP